MSHLLWRIATDTKAYTAEDMSGTGAKISGGRWNEVGVGLVYSSGSRALACLETVVHLNAGGLPFNRYLVEIDVPDDVWQAAKTADPSTLPVGWDAEPAGLESIRYGSAWVAGIGSALLLVPSVIVPEERNALINPLHPDAAKIKAHKVRRWLYDPRLGRGSTL
ncbi:MAG TPA: RES family NAD+ phosphorylase [Bosea sp. (in: a-proteobacteria)]